MPIYEYRCQACGAELEKLQKISDDPLVDCPECGQPELKKKISAAGFRLSGTGWYETDFKTGKKKNLTGGSGQSSEGKSGPSTTPGSQSTSQSTSKPTAAPTPKSSK